MLALQGSTQSCYKDMDDKLKATRKQLSKDHAKILNCLEDLGLICAYEVWLQSQLLKTKEKMD
jgi:endoribonuclease Dicer